MKDAAKTVKGALVAMGAIALSACITSEPARVTFGPKMPIVDAADTSLPIRYDLRIPDRDAAYRTSIFEQLYAGLGREDLTAATSDEYRPASCAPHPSNVSGEQAVLDAIVDAAENARIVIVNESHVVSRHRNFTAELAARLEPLGFTHFAAETFSNPTDGVPPVLESVGLPYPRDVDGHYSSEPAFGRLLRTVKRLGYIPVPYEDNVQRDRSAPVAQQIAWREAFQAQALADALAEAGPDARMLVHVGYSHARETPIGFSDGREDLWMAARLRDLTGIDPLTISQYQCREESGPIRLAGNGPDAPEGAFDFVIAHPVTRFEGQRPTWRAEAGDLRVSVPAPLIPTQGAHVVEARLSGEPEAAVPMDRVLIFPGETVDLLLPAGNYELRAVQAMMD
ncbi:hypothetical protein [Aurantiacibacter aquimixticola]|nr:hypothetical protein [Aurantiacibacter aquimixticola]